MTNTTLHSNDLDRSLYTIKPLPPLLPFISDAHLLLILPIVAYWAYGLLFYWIDQHDYLPQYRLHTPAEFLKRNRVPVSEVVTYVLKYQLLTTVIGVLLSGDADTYGMEEYHVAIWASRVKALGSLVPTAALAYLGVSIELSFPVAFLPASNETWTGRGQTSLPTPKFDGRIISRRRDYKLATVPRKLHLLLSRAHRAICNRHLLRRHMAILLSPIGAHQPLALQ